MKSESVSALNVYIKSCSAALILLFLTFIIAHLLPGWYTTALTLTSWFLFITGSLCLYPSLRVGGKPFAVWITLVFIVVFILSALGAANDALFGAYEYGTTLGLRFFDTPLVSVFVWTLVLYAATRFAQSRLQGTSGVVGESIVAVCTGVVVMFYKSMLVPLAPRLGYFNFEAGQVGFKFYFTWFVIGSIASFTYLYYIKPRVNKADCSEQDKAVEKAASRLVGLFAICQTLFLVIVRIFWPEAGQ
jgi:putative membrane protein